MKHTKNSSINISQKKRTLNDFIQCYLELFPRQIELMNSFLYLIFAKKDEKRNSMFS